MTTSSETPDSDAIEDAADLAAARKAAAEFEASGLPSIPIERVASELGIKLPPRQASQERERES